MAAGDTEGMGWDPLGAGTLPAPCHGTPIVGGLRVPSPEVRGGCVGQVRGTAGVGGSTRDGPREDAAAASQVHLQPRSGDEPWSSADFSSEGFHLLSLLIRAGKAFL